MIPQKKSGLNQLGSLAQVAGPIVSLIPGGQLAGAALTAGGTAVNVLNAPKQQPGSQGGIDTMSSMRRRQSEENPQESLISALDALETLGLDDQQYQTYKAPIYAALNKNREIV